MRLLVFPSATARRTVIQAICTVFVLAIVPELAHALTPGQVFDKVKDAVVVVKTLDTQGKRKSQGSGVLISPGRVATNCHVVEGGASFQVGRGDQFVPATLYAEDWDKDICLLNATGIQGSPVQLGQAATLKVGDPVFAVGAPRGLELSLSDGIVAQLRGAPPPLIQTTAAISPGSSGGGLFDGDGRLVGLTTLYLEGGQSLNFAMPVEWINDVKPGRKPVAEGRAQTEWLKRAIALEKVKDWQGLIGWCRKWTNSDPGNVGAWGFLAIAYTKLARYNEAIDAFRQAIRVNPAYTDAWYALGIDYTKLARYNEAIDAFRQAIRVDPAYASAWNGLGAAYCNLTRYDEAIDAFRQAIRVDPAVGGFWHNLGIAYNDSARYTDAINAFREAVRIDPAYTDAWYQLGIAYTNSGNRAAALTCVRELRRLDPARADQLFNRIVPR